MEAGATPQSALDELLRGEVGGDGMRRRLLLLLLEELAAALRDGDGRDPTGWRQTGWRQTGWHTGWRRRGAARGRRGSEPGAARARRTGRSRPADVGGPGMAPGKQADLGKQAGQQEKGRTGGPTVGRSRRRREQRRAAARRRERDGVAGAAATAALPPEVG